MLLLQPFEKNLRQLGGFVICLSGVNFSALSERSWCHCFHDCGLSLLSGNSPQNSCGAKVILWYIKVIYTWIKLNLPSASQQLIHFFAGVHVVGWNLRCDVCLATCDLTSKAFVEPCFPSVRDAGSRLLEGRPELSYIIYKSQSHITATPQCWLYCTVGLFTQTSCYFSCSLSFSPSVSPSFALRLFFFLPSPTL